MKRMVFTFASTGLLIEGATCKFNSHGEFLDEVKKERDRTAFWSLIGREPLNAKYGECTDVRKIHTHVSASNRRIF